jgi:hypothetical protein
VIFLLVGVFIAVLLVVRSFSPVAGPDRKAFVQTG